MTITRGAAATDEDEAAPNAAAPTPPLPVPAPGVHEPPPLEALIEAIVAQRLARQELATGPDGPTIADQAPRAPKRPRTRKPPSDRPSRPG